MKRLLYLGASLALLLSLGGTAEAQKVQKTNDTKGYTYGNYYLSAWRLNFNYNKGSFTRTWDGNRNNNRLDYLWINIRHQHINGTYVGFDAGAGRNAPTGVKVADLSSYNNQYKSPKINRGVGFKWTSRMQPIKDAYWYMGPKTIISSTKSYSGLDNQYECYIIENNSLGNANFVKELGLKYDSQGTYDGSVYKHYRKRLGKIYQVWSIRQKRRNQGWTSVNWIQRQWYLRGLVPWNYYNLGWKVNVETAGGWKNGSNMGFSNLNLPFN